MFVCYVDLSFGRQVYCCQEEVYYEEYDNDSEVYYSLLCKTVYYC